MRMWAETGGTQSSSDLYWERQNTKSVIVLSEGFEHIWLLVIENCINKIK